MWSCEKDITVDLPEAESKLVVEGRIEADSTGGLPPIVILTKSVGYFEPTDLNTIQSLFVHNATVSVSVDGKTYALEEVCLNNLDPQLVPLAAEFLGLSEEDLKAFNYCIYTVPLTDLISGNYLKGEVGKTYTLRVLNEGKEYTSETRIPELVSLDSLWFEARRDDTLGFAFATMTDPPEFGNANRWFAKRLNVAKADNGYLAPFGSAFDDEFINGVSFEFAYDRPDPPGFIEDEPGEVGHYYKLGDTVAIKFCTIDRGVFDFLRIYEVEISSNGSPFASPSTIPTNIKGGALGFWAGYGASYDTLFVPLK